MSQAEKIINNSVALMAAHAYQTAVGLITVGLIARYLKPDRFGEYGFIMALCMILVVATDMGINRIGIREVARDLSRANDVLVASFLVKMALSIVSLMAIFLIINVISDDKGIISATCICAVAIAVYFMGDIFDSLFKAFEKMGYVTLSAFLERTVYLVCISRFIKMDLGLQAAFWALLASYSARFVFGLIVTCKKFFLPRVACDPSLCVLLVREGFPVGVNRILRKATLRLDTILIKLIRSATEVGFFHGAYRIILALEFIPVSVTGAMFPMFSRLAVGSKGSTEKALEKSFKFLLIIAIPIVISLLFFADHIALLVLGRDFADSAQALQVFAFVAGAMFCSGLFIKVLNAFNKQALAAKAVAVCLVINVVLDIVLIMFFGYMGAVIATLVAEAALVMIAYHLIARNVSSVPFGKVLPKPFLCGIFMAIAYYLLSSMNVAIALVGGLVVYLCGLFVLRVFEQDETDGMLKILQKLHGNAGSLVLRSNFLKNKK